MTSRVIKMPKFLILTSLLIPFGGWLSAQEEDKALQGLKQNLSAPAGNPLVVGKNKIYEPDKTFESFVKVALEGNSKIRIPEGFSAYTLHTWRLTVFPGAMIFRPGSNGKSGAPGINGTKGSRCNPGTSGANGQFGGNGSDGTSISLVARELVVIGNPKVDTFLKVDTSAGHGGNGGKGGDGGIGGRADRSKTCNGGNGGNGGDGGKAGDGGNGGGLSVSFNKVFWISSDHNKIPIDYDQWVTSKLNDDDKEFPPMLPYDQWVTVIEHVDSGGKSGAPGPGGIGGKGGRGRGKDFFGRSFAGGADGRDGISGAAGRGGKRGSMTIKPLLLETD